MNPFPRRAALAAALASIGALAAPAVAGANVAPPDVTNDTLTVSSDGEGDTITLAAAAGVLTVNGTATTLNANANAAIVVNAAGGADTVDASALAAANYGTLVVNAGEGDDLVTGGANADQIRGDGGNDRLIGFRGSTDVVSGGEGDDVMVWNNGDGTDKNDGDAGTDEVEVNGAPNAADSFTFKANPDTPGRVQFNRLNLVMFGIDLSAERLTVNGLGGGDLMAPDPDTPGVLNGLTAITLNGGGGDDELVGADGADQINGGGGLDILPGAEGADLIRGGDDSDQLFGDGGDDRLIGDRGADTLAGGSGDDALVWNNGDASDVDAGEAGFDRLEVNGSPTGGDWFDLAPDGENAKFQRTNLVPFSIELSSSAADGDEPNGGVEAVAINGGGGGEELTVEPGLPDMLVVADGDAGDDTMVGAEEADSFFGGSGADTLDPGNGSDLADGEEGDDHLFSRDGAGDLVRGGVGTDDAQTDEVTVDAVSGVEVLDAIQPPAPPANDAKALLPKLGRIAVTRKHGKLIARAPVTCPAAEAGGCRTTLTLETAKAVRLGPVRAVVVLGSRSANLRPGQRSIVSIRLSRGAAALARHGKLAARARIASQDAAGNIAFGSRAVTLRFAG